MYYMNLVPKIVSTTDSFNIFNVNNLHISFKKHYILEYNEFRINSFYDYSPIYNNKKIIDDGTFLNTEFNRRDRLTYIKLKDKWLYKMNKKLYFSKINCRLFSRHQPLVFWIEYLKDNQFILSVFEGRGLDNITQNNVVRIDNNQFLIYNFINNKIEIKFVDDINYATRFVFSKPLWNEFSWIKLKEKPNA